MAKIQFMGAALVAATVVAGCCDKECGKTPEADASAAATAEAAAPAKDPEEVIVAVCGKTLKRGELDADVGKALAAQAGRIPAEQLAMARKRYEGQAAQQFMVEAILLAKAGSLGYAISDEDMKAREAEFLKAVADAPDAPKTLEEAFAKHPLGRERALEEFKNGVLIDKMLKAEVLDKDTGDYTAKAQEIVDRVIAENAKCLDDAGALAKITELKKTLDETAEDGKAAKFAEIAKAESGCPSGRSGGDLGEFTHGQMVKEFDEAAFGAEIGQVVGPVKTQFGYHLIMTTKKIPAVEASGDKPGEPEKCQASHILVKICEKQPVPELEKVVGYLKNNANRGKIQAFIMDAIKGAAIKVADEFKFLLPPPDEPAPEAKPEAAPAAAAEEGEKAVETSPEK